MNRLPELDLSGLETAVHNAVALIDALRNERDWYKNSLQCIADGLQGREPQEFAQSVLLGMPKA